MLKVYKTLEKNLVGTTDATSKVKDQIFTDIFAGNEKLILSWNELKKTAIRLKDEIDNGSEEYNEAVTNLINDVKAELGTTTMPDFILYDEAGGISFFERDVLTKLGIKIVAMGDLTQTGYSHNGEPLDIDYFDQLFKTPKLPIGIRFDNIYIKESNLILHQMVSELNRIAEANLTDQQALYKLNEIKKEYK